MEQQLFPGNGAGSESTAQEQKQGLEPIVLSEGNITIPGEVREQIDQKVEELKKKNGIKKVFVIVVKGDADAGEKPLYIGYFRRPNMMHFSQYMTFVQKDIVQANQMLAQNTFLDGDRELFANEDVFLFGTMQQLGHIIDSRNSDIVKK